MTQPRQAASAPKNKQTAGSSMRGQPQASSVGLTPGTTDEKSRHGMASLTENCERPLVSACDIMPRRACRGHAGVRVGTRDEPGQVAALRRRTIQRPAKTMAAAQETARRLAMKMARQVALSKLPGQQYAMAPPRFAILAADGEKRCKNCERVCRPCSQRMFTDSQILKFTERLFNWSKQGTTDPRVALGVISE